MKPIREVLADLMLSPWLQVGRGAVAALSCLLILDVIKMTPIDAAAFAFPDTYLPVMLVGALVTGIVTAVGVRFKLHETAETHKIANGKIAKAGDLPYDKRYDMATFVGLVAGAIVGMVLAALLVPEWFVNAGTWTYFLMTVGCTFVSVIAGILIFHFGVRWFITNLTKKAKEITGAVKDAKVDIDSAVENLDGIVDLRKEE